MAALVGILVDAAFIGLAYWVGMRVGRQDGYLKAIKECEAVIAEADRNVEAAIGAVSDLVKKGRGYEQTSSKSPGPGA